MVGQGMVGRGVGMGLKYKINKFIKARRGTARLGEVGLGAAGQGMGFKKTIKGEQWNS